MALSAKQKRYASRYEPEQMDVIHLAKEALPAQEQSLIDTTAIRLSGRLKAVGVKGGIELLYMLKLYLLRRGITEAELAAYIKKNGGK